MEGGVGVGVVTLVIMGVIDIGVNAWPHFRSIVSKFPLDFSALERIRKHDYIVWQFTITDLNF